jgi:ribosomal protein S18 acetylase RimI-like enzyme
MERGYRPAAMSTVEMIPFSERHLDGAALLLAARHERHRASEPLLPLLTDARAQVERVWRSATAGGSAAVEDGLVAGYLLGEQREDQLGPHAWSEPAGHAVREPELVRDLYGVASRLWVDAGLTRHFVLVPALRDLVEPWFRLSFGASAALAVRETAVEAPVATDVVIRESVPADIEAVVALDHILLEVNAAAPSFSSLRALGAQELLDEWRDTWESPDFVHFLAERDGVPVGHLLLYRRPAGDVRVPPDSIDLANAATVAEVRDQGVGRALTAHALTWAHEHGYTAMTVDWRMTNLHASRFWPRRGFRETFLRLYRSIP